MCQATTSEKLLLAQSCSSSHADLGHIGERGGGKSSEYLEPQFFEYRGTRGREETRKGN